MPSGGKGRGSKGGGGGKKSTAPKVIPRRGDLPNNWGERYFEKTYSFGLQLYLKLRKSSAKRIHKIYMYINT